jgi:hypothetical protein
LHLCAKQATVLQLQTQQRRGFNMRTIFTGVIMSLLLAASPAVSQENTILNAMTAVVESEDGGEIAQGLLQIGATLTAMSVDETIAFRTSLILLHR